MSTITDPIPVLSSSPPIWATLASAIVRRLPMARYRVMNWLCRRLSARFVARIPATKPLLRFECDLRNRLSREVYFMGIYEPQETMIIRRLVNPGGVFVDVGSHWGYFTLLMANHVGSSGRIVAIEADPRIYATLERSVALNHLPQIRTIHAAAAAEVGILSLMGYDEHEENWAISRIASDSSRTSFQVPAVPIDDLLDRLDLDVIDLIKMDIEGAEALALAGMSDGLRRGRYPRILLELHPAELDEHGIDAASIIEDLLKIGYQAWVIAHAPGDVRRAAYVRWRPDDPIVRPLRWPEPLDVWPHLIFVLGDLPLYTDVAEASVR